MTDPKVERLRDFAAVARADGRPAMADQLRAIADEVEQQAEKLQHDAMVILSMDADHDAMVALLAAARADLDHANAKAVAARADADALAEKLERVTAQRDALLTAIDQHGERRGHDPNIWDHDLAERLVDASDMYDTPSFQGHLMRRAADMLERQAERIHHDAMVILSMDAELAEARMRDAN